MIGPIAEGAGFCFFGWTGIKVSFPLTFREYNTVTVYSNRVFPFFSWRTWNKSYNILSLMFKTEKARVLGNDKVGYHLQVGREPTPAGIGEIEILLLSAQLNCAQSGEIFFPPCSNLIQFQFEFLHSSWKLKLSNFILLEYCLSKKISFKQNWTPKNLI